MRQHTLIVRAEDLAHMLNDGGRLMWGTLAEIKERTRGKSVLVRIDFPEAQGGVEVRVRIWSRMAALLWWMLRRPVDLWEE